jgi:hypothetical protein
MNTDFQIRKLKAIEFIAALQDKKKLSYIELAIEHISKSDEVVSEFKVLTKEDIIERAKTSSKQYESGAYQTQDELLNEAENW